VARLLTVLPNAQADVDRQTAFLTETSSDALADRFLVEVETVFERLIRFRQLGRTWQTREPDLKDLRRIRLPTFRSSIFYRASPDTVEIIRVLHDSRDLPPELRES